MTDFNKEQANNSSLLPFVHNLFDGNFNAETEKLRYKGIAEKGLIKSLNVKGVFTNGLSEEFREYEINSTTDSFNIIIKDINKKIIQDITYKKETIYLISDIEPQNGNLPQGNYEVFYDSESFDPLSVIYKMIN